jgi:hypothetical protein
MAKAHKYRVKNICGYKWNTQRSQLTILKQDKLTIPKCIKDSKSTLVTANDQGQQHTHNDNGTIATKE